MLDLINQILEPSASGGAAHAPEILLEDGSGGIQLEDGSGNIILE